MSYNKNNKEKKDMEKKKIMGCLGIIALFIIAIGIIMIVNPSIKTDGMKFKEEYEKLNDTIRESDGAKYNNVSIDAKNPIKYINAKEAIDIIKNKTGIIYFGANWCPWCRNAIEVLFESTKEKNLKTIYYLDMDSVRNIWEIKDGKLEKTTVEQEGYYELLEALDSVLSENTYTLKDNSGKVYDTKEKRIGMPLIIAVKDGKIIEKHSGTVKLKENQTKYSKLEQDQKEELLKNYNEMIDKIK